MGAPYVQIVTQGVFPLTRQIASASSASTSSSTNALMTGMTVTPPAGTYLCMFNSDIETNAAGGTVTSLFMLGGAAQGGSQQKISPFDGGVLSVGSARGIMALQYVLTANGSQSIEVWWSVSSGTATVANRTLVLMQVTAI